MFSIIANIMSYVMSSIAERSVIPGQSHEQEMLIPSVAHGSVIDCHSLILTRNQPIYGSYKPFAHVLRGVQPQSPSAKSVRAFALSVIPMLIAQLVPAEQPYTTHFLCRDVHQIQSLNHCLAPKFQMSNRQRLCPAPPLDTPLWGF